MTSVVVNVKTREIGQGGPGAGGPPPPAVIRPARPWDLCEPEERDWFGALGDGLVIVLPPQADAAWPRAGGAWLHVAPSGTVTAFTGQVVVGQDNQTAFRLLVAKELAVDPDDVQVVQGDTDLCPYDAGTFGRRSRPDSGEAEAALRDAGRRDATGGGADDGAAVQRAVRLEHRREAARHVEAYRGHRDPLFRVRHAAIRNAVRRGSAPARAGSRAAGGGLRVTRGHAGCHDRAGR